MVNFRDYVTFDLPEAAASNPDAQQFILQGDDRALVERGLHEIASTPEGAELLQRVASRFPDGKIPIFKNPGGHTLVVKVDGVDGHSASAIVMGDIEASAKYFSPETGGYHDLSIQRTLFHELKHFDLDHLEGAKGRIPLEKENETVQETNIFMQKYYGEPPRGDYLDLRFDGTEKWDFSKRAQSSRGLEGWIKDNITDIFDGSAVPTSRDPAPSNDFNMPMFDR